MVYASSIFKHANNVLNMLQCVKPAKHLCNFTWTQFDEFEEYTVGFVFSEYCSWSAPPHFIKDCWKIKEPNSSIFSNREKNKYINK